MNVVEVRDVVKDYTAHRALDHVNMSVEKGKVHGLLGPNGAGKTTLIRILNRITAPDKGTITFEGRPFAVSDLERIGYLPEERGLYRKMKVGEQAIYLAQLKGLSHKEAKDKLTQWFEKLDIMNWWDKKVEELSKGMAQKVQFISTVMHEPSLLIFDEPFSGFDPVNAELLKREILELRDKGSTIIFSTHNMQSVEEVCDNITLINKSKVVLDGNVRSIRDRYKGNKYRITLDGDLNIPAILREKYHVEEELKDNFGLSLFTVLNPNKVSAAELVTDWCHAGNMTRFEEVVPSMHQIFLDVVGAATVSNNTSTERSNDE
ncbi:ABC transporter ATP-binding protein [Porphyromonas sp.]|uniref:ABC transporter ATP-binding protein n=1 Tax=Porphyromonas sp. TaxID=1924944 RepID=UPI0026DD8E9D|nr:ABC transporter ATP-binding protein [Porphyromonas sp.]MDO4695823.1 ABC transporter ATP-binding protein [Porphyromonas sp.]MDO4771820.1 ABC transporter ATP-binding protein [Porphyromonas sp.]